MTHEYFMSSAIAATTIRLSKRPEGVRPVDISSIYGSAATSKALTKLKAAGYLYFVVLANRSYHYFSTQAAADAYADKLKAPVAVAAAPITLAPRQTETPKSGQLASIGPGARTHATWSRAREGEPGYVEPTYPTDAAGQPLYTLTRAAPLPDPRRTNTHGGMA